MFYKHQELIKSRDSRSISNNVVVVCLPLSLWTLTFVTFVDASEQPTCHLYLKIITLMTLKVKCQDKHLTFFNQNKPSSKKSCWHFQTLSPHQKTGRISHRRYSSFKMDSKVAIHWRPSLVDLWIKFSSLPKMF